MISHFEDMPAQLAALGIAEQDHLRKAHALLEQGSVIGKLVLKDF